VGARADLGKSFGHQLAGTCGGDPGPSPSPHRFVRPRQISPSVLVRATCEGLRAVATGPAPLARLRPAGTRSTAALSIQGSYSSASRSGLPRHLHLCTSQPRHRRAIDAFEEFVSPLDRRHQLAVRWHRAADDRRSPARLSAVAPGRVASSAQRPRVGRIPDRRQGCRRRRRATTDRAAVATEVRRHRRPRVHRATAAKPAGRTSRPGRGRAVDAEERRPVPCPRGHREAPTRTLTMSPRLLLDEVTTAGRENLDSNHVARYDRSCRTSLSWCCRRVGSPGEGLEGRPDMLAGT